MRYILILLTAIASSSSIAKEISDFKAGSVCTDGKTFAWVCHETVRIYVTGQEECTYNKKKVPCTWHGFEFNYKGFSKNTVVECTSTSSEVTSSGNPEEIAQKNATTETYRVDVPEGNGYFINPQYKVLTTPEAEPKVFYEHTMCSLNGKKQAEYNHEFVFPANPNP